MTLFRREHLNSVIQRYFISLNEQLRGLQFILHFKQKILIKRRQNDNIASMNNKKNTVVGIIAHVDAGKTTLCEALLYLSGKIKKPGRVDHRDCFFDNKSIERERGITVFSKQAVIELPESSVTILDTPGHADLCAETERVLPVLDCAVLVISATDGVQAHTETVWKLLRRYSVPCMVFVTKMDICGTDRERVINQLQERLSDGCTDFNMPEGELFERLAMCSEDAMDKYLEGGRLDSLDIAALISHREVFPCFFGSGLYMDGVNELLNAMDAYITPAPDDGAFGARVFKIARDEKGGRLTYMKICGGALKTRELVSYTDESGSALSEKINQIRLYSGARFEAVESVVAGQVCAVTGLSASFAGQGIGAARDMPAPLIEPVISYRLILPPEQDAALVLPKLRELEEEDPMLRLRWDQRAGEISVQLMGRVQAEVFIALLLERFGINAKLDTGRIMYRETIENKVEGVGHFEPLRHYAEVHLILEPLPQGSGIELCSICPEDELERSWQRLILTHLQEKQHVGVLTGAPLDDMKITVAAGRAHPKHTEGGDFRQATYRALRQGLMQAKSVLLEPYYSFVLTVPTEQIGRAISDVRAMNGSFSSPEESGGMSRLEGKAPVAAMNGYAQELAAYTHGKGRLSLDAGGYFPCKDPAPIIEAAGYDPDTDTDNPSYSVFCAHGGGFDVPWDKVRDYMHLESCLKQEKTPPPAAHRCISIDERELEAIMEREFGPIRRAVYSTPTINAAPAPVQTESQRQYIIVDGYNLIFSNEELKRLAGDRLDLSRGRLMDMLVSYCGYTKAELVLVFDGFRTPNNLGSRAEYHNIHVAYTATGETADAYIERIAAEIGRNYAVRVVTSDNLIRLSALRAGVLRTSSKEFSAELEQTLKSIDEILKKSNMNAHKTRLRDGKQ